MCTLFKSHSNEKYFINVLRQSLDWVALLWKENSHEVIKGHCESAVRAHCLKSLEQVVREDFSTPIESLSGVCSLFMDALVTLPDKHHLPKRVAG